MIYNMVYVSSLDENLGSLLCECLPQVVENPVVSQ